MDVKAITLDYLKAHGFDGLFAEGQCGCKLDDLFCCGMSGVECCEPGYLQPDVPAEFDFCIGPDKPAQAMAEAPRQVHIVPGAVTLDAVRAVLDSDEHYKATATRNYGGFDPIVETRQHINACVCGGPGTLVNDTPAIRQLRGAQSNVVPTERWFVRCERCQSAGPAARHNWQAVLDWNRGRLSAKPAYADLPLFGLRPLDRHQALDRLNGIRYDLELRLKEASAKRVDDSVADANKPGGRYVARLRAYLAWAIYAQALLKLARKAAHDNRHLPV